MTRRVHIGDVAIGGGAPIIVQSMCNTETADVEATVAQIERLERAGCEIVRVTVPDLTADDPFPDYDTEPVMAYANDPEFAA